MASKQPTGDGVPNGGEPTTAATAGESTQTGVDLNPPTSPTVAAERRITDVLQPGATIGRYVVLERIGSGGMGLVYAAYDPKLDRRIALKVLRPDGRSLTGAARERLLREAKAIAQVSHTNVVHAYDVGVFGGETFVAMEYVEGRSLRSYCVERKRSWREVLELYVGAGLGLAAAHAAGVIHRDFKPANVIVGSDGRPRVADFGLAARVEREPSPSPTTPAAELEAIFDSSTLDERITVTGTVLGTPAYMAPELLRGFPADEKTDQYAFCISLYEGLYGQRPFAGSKRDLLIAKQLGDVQPPVSGREVPGWLRSVVVRGLSPDPDQRWPSIEALLAELRRDPHQQRRRLILGGVIGASLLGLVAGWYFSRRPANETCQLPQRRTAALWSPEIAGEIEKAFIATGLAYAGDSWSRLSPRVEEYVAAWGESHLDACRAHSRGEQSGELLDRRMACLGRREAELGALLEVFAGADARVVNKAADAVAALTPLEYCADPHDLLGQIPEPRDPDVVAAVADTRSVLARVKALYSAGLYGTALVDARAAADRATEIDSAPCLAEALYWRGELEIKASDYAGAGESLAEAFFVAQGAKHDDFAIRAGVSLVYLKGVVRPEPQAARQWFRATEAMVTRTGTTPAREADLIFSRGLMLDIEGDYRQALVEFERALKLRLQAYGGQHLQVAYVHESLGRMNDRLGSPSAALDHYLEAQKIREAVQGREHPGVASTIGFRGMTLFRAGRYAGAEPLFRRVLEIRERTLGPDHEYLSWAMFNLGETLLALRQIEPARSYFARARSIQGKTLPEDDPHQVFGLTVVGRLAWIDGDDATAERLLSQAIAVVERKLGPEHPWLHGPLVAIGEVMLHRGQHDRARESCERARAIAVRAVGDEDQDAAAATLCLARTAITGGNDEQGAVLLRRALETIEQTVGDEHELAMAAHYQLGRLAARRHDLESARRHCQRAIAIGEPLYGGDHPSLIGPLLCLAATERSSDSLTGESIERAQAIADAFVGRLDPVELDLVAELGEATRR